MAEANVTTGLAEVIAALASNPSVSAAIIIQVLLGFAAGYYMAKIAKYVFALVGIFILGALVGAWGVSGSVEEALKQLGKSIIESKDQLLAIIRAFGFLLVGPTAVGFVLGVLVGLIKR